MKIKSEIEPLETGTREMLLETASYLFASKGYASTSVREIVARAVVSFDFRKLAWDIGDEYFQW